MKTIFSSELASLSPALVVAGCLAILSCDSKRGDSKNGLQSGHGKGSVQQENDGYQETSVSKEVPKKKSELTQKDFQNRIGEALGKYAITEEDSSEVEELFLLNREWAIAAIRGARMPWLLGEILGKNEEYRKTGIQWIEENLKGQERDLCLIGFAKGLGKSDPKLMISMVENMNPGLVRDRVVGAAILATAKSDIARASDIFLQNFDDLKRGSEADLYGTAAGLVIEMNNKLSSDEMKTMMAKPIFEKLLEINPQAILMVGDKYPEVAVQFCLEGNGDPASLYGMVLRHLASNDALGVDRILKTASGRYNREEMVAGVLSLLSSNEHESMGSVLTKLPSTSYDEEIFTRAASYLQDNEFNKLMISIESDARKGYLLKGLNERK